MRVRALVIVFVLTVPAFAVTPDEVLDDPVLEGRARAISKLLRCPVCQGESIDDSHAAISRDLRLYVRERLQDGDSDGEVIDAVTARFGEFVLFEPRASGGNLLLYLAGPVMALLALLIGWRFLRGRARSAAPEAPPLSPEEQAELDRILGP